MLVLSFYFQFLEGIFGFYVSKASINSVLQKFCLKFTALVLFREDNLPPSQWALGRVSDVYRGADGVVRMVTIRLTKDTIGAASKYVKRPCTKIVLIPNNG